MTIPLANSTCGSISRRLCQLPPRVWQPAGVVIGCKYSAGMLTLTCYGYGIKFGITSATPRNSLTVTGNSLISVMNPRVTMGSAGAARRPTASPASARRRRASLWRPTGKQPALCWACWTDTPRYSALGDPVPGPQASGSPLNSRSIPAPLPLKVSSYNGWHCRRLT